MGEKVSVDEWGYRVAKQVLDVEIKVSKRHKRRKNSWKFIYVLANKSLLHFNKFFDRLKYSNVVEIFAKKT